MEVIQSPGSDGSASRAFPSLPTSAVEMKSYPAVTRRLNSGWLVRPVSMIATVTPEPIDLSHAPRRSIP